MAARDSGKSMLDAALGEVMTTCEKLSWLIREGEQHLRPEKRTAGLMVRFSEYAGLGRKAEIQFGTIILEDGLVQKPRVISHHCSEPLSGTACSDLGSFMFHPIRMYPPERNVPVPMFKTAARSNGKGIHTCKQAYLRSGH